MKQLQDLKSSLLNPKKFYSKLKVKGKKQVINFMILNYALFWLIEYLLTMLRLHRPLAPFVATLWMLTSLPLVILGIFLVILLLYLINRLLKGEGGPLKSLSAFGYTSGVWVFLANLNVLAIIYQLYLIFLSSKRFHNLSTNRALVIVIILGLIEGVLASLLGLFNLR
jgi:hypothetical protein